MTNIWFEKAPRWLRDFVPLILWMALIYGLSSQSRLFEIQDEAADKLFFKSSHFVTYAILAWFWWRALAPRRQLSWSIVMITWLLSILYGISDEIHQLYVPGRHGSVADVLFDASGALFMLLALRRIRWLRVFSESL